MELTPLSFLPTSNKVKRVPAKYQISQSLKFNHPEANRSVISLWKMEGCSTPQTSPPPRLLTYMYQIQYGSCHASDIHL